jgi:UDP-4-amino-4-deoxy-L-arabinose-oxoglutarate aminotransferase
MDNIQAALLLPQLQNIDKAWGRRKRIFEAYSAAFEALPQIEGPKIPYDSKSAHHLFTIWVEKSKRDKMIRMFGDKQVGVAVNYRAIHLLTYLRQKYGFRREDFPVAEEIGDRTISLPLYPRLKDDEIHYVIDITKKIVRSV